MLDLQPGPDFPERALATTATKKIGADRSDSLFRCKRTVRSLPPIQTTERVRSTGRSMALAANLLPSGAHSARPEIEGRH
jgi:hypothetical protein